MYISNAMIAENAKVLVQPKQVAQTINCASNFISNIVKEMVLGKPKNQRELTDYPEPDTNEATGKTIWEYAQSKVKK